MSQTGIGVGHPAASGDATADEEAWLGQAQLDFEREPVPPDIGPRAGWLRRLGPSRLAIDTSWSLASQVITLLCSTFSFLLLSRNLHAAGLGAFVGLYALLGPFDAFSQTGVTFTVMEHLVRLKEDAGAAARSAISIILVGAAVLVPPVLVLSVTFLQGMSVVTIILLTFTEFVPTAAIGALIATLQGTRGFVPGMRFRMIATLARFSMFAALAATNNLTLQKLAVAQALVCLSVMALLLWRVKTVVGSWPRPGAIQPGHVRSSFLYGLGISASGAQYGGDTFVLNAAGFQSDAGRYGAAYRVVGIGLLPIHSLIDSTHLSFLDSAERNDPLKRAIRLARLSLMYAIPAMIGLFLVAPLVPDLLGHDFEGTAEMIRWLTPIVVFRGLGAFPANGLMGLGRNALRTKIVATNAIASIVLYLALIPTYSWRGGVVATLVSEASLFVSSWAALFICRRQRGQGPRAFPCQQIESDASA